MSRGTVLVVDDNPTNLKLMRLLLTASGFTVRTATAAEEALQSVRDGRPELILMDLQLPGMSGLELTGLLKRDPATSSIVIVAVTAYAMKGDEEKARAAGCDAYLAKPIDVDTLPDAVAAWIRGAGAP